MMGQQQTVAGSTLLRRMVLALAIAAVIALLMMALAAPAFTVNIHGTNADQVGKQASGVNQPDSPGYVPGRGGKEVTAGAAQRHSGTEPLSDVGDIARSSHNNI